MWCHFSIFSLPSFLPPPPFGKPGGMLVTFINVLLNCDVYFKFKIGNTLCSAVKQMSLYFRFSYIMTVDIIIFTYTRS